MNNTIVIIGGGHAGFQLSTFLRRDGFEGHIIILEKQNSYPYKRPPLSKSFLLGLLTEDELLLRSPEFYKSNNIEIIFSEVTMVDRVKKIVLCGNGENIYYDTLILAMGVSPKRLDFCEFNYDNIHVFSDLQEVKNLKSSFEKSRSIVIVGTGFIGLETASCANSLSKKVHIISAGSQLMRRSLSAQTSSIVKSQHVSNNIIFHDNEKIIDWTVENNRIISVTLSSKEVLPIDLIIVGIGSKPNIGLANLIGLDVNDGVIVNKNLQTSDPSIYAIGDCARFPYIFNHSVRLESIQNTADQSRYLSKRILGREMGDYKALPWFWSDQGNMKIQVAGLNPDISRKLDMVTLDSALSSGHTCLGFLDDILTSVETINNPTVHMIAKKILSGSHVPSKSELSKYNFELSSWLNSISTISSFSRSSV